ncbi:MAG: radical SAM family heme chaperone HemW [Treponema sp.]|nr:radical SAM family heme chaperone HemW [Treponema sp.]
MAPESARHSLSSSIASLYIHVPFCAVKCGYCDFYSIPLYPIESIELNDDRLAAYVDKVLEDCEYAINQYDVKQIPSVYIGGGTPSILGSSLIKRLLNGLKFSSEEITLEANPESCDEDFLTAAKESGVTRISLGIQTFNEASRRLVQRKGEAKLLPQKLKALSEIFGSNFSVDLISGLPSQDEDVLMADIDRVLSFEPGHISLYALTVDPETPLGIAVAKAEIQLPDKDEADRFWIKGRDALEAAGYAQYEVSNFSIPGNESRHNLRYWRMENWLGIGPAASGTIINDDTGTGQRFTVARDIDNWLRRSPGEQPPGIVEALDSITLIKETFLMGFRLADGPDTDLFQLRFKHSIEEIIPKTINAWRKRGFFQEHKTALTKQGLLLLDAFLVEAFEEVHP